MSGKIHFIYHRISHHSPHSGYDRLRHYIPHSDQYASWPKKVIESLNNSMLERWVRGTPLTWYNRDRLLSEAVAAGSFLTSVGHLYHYLYGEDSYYYLSKLPNWGRNRIVVSFHQPPSQFQRAVTRADHLKRVDAIVTVSNTQRAFFEDLCERNRVFYVPHGVDTEFFCPSAHPNRGEEKRCLFVGKWLRDMDLLAEVIRAFQSPKRGPVRFILITFERYWERFKSFRNVDLFSGIPEQGLLDLYRSCDLLFLPLIDCSANNTVLEALACGLPVATTDVGGIRDYADEKCALLLPPGDVEAAVESLSRLLWDEERLAEMSLQGSLRAAAFDWSLVAAAMKDVYRKIMV